MEKVYKWHLYTAIILLLVLTYLIGISIQVKYSIDTGYYYHSFHVTNTTRIVTGFIAFYILVSFLLIIIYEYRKTHKKSESKQ